jgi:hypothetical protein
MGERRIPLPNEYEEIIAAFDRERTEAQKLSRRYREIIAQLRRHDRPVTQEGDDRDQ